MQRRDGTGRSEQDVQADVNVILDTLLKTHDFVERIVAAPGWAGGPAPVVDFALDAVKRLRKDALGV